MTPQAGIPPGVHLQARFEPPGLPPRQLRILGDDQRGYLVTGLADIDDEGDFWFATLSEAVARVEALGVDPQAWQEISDADEVRMF